LSAQQSLAAIGRELIHVTPQDTAAFFGIPVLPEPQVPAEIPNTLEADDMANDGMLGSSTFLMSP
jgi:hypothetical protein